MAKCLVGAAGGLPAADRAKLIPANIRAGVTLFAGTQKELIGTLEPADELDVLATMYYYQGAISQVIYWTGSGYAIGSVQTGFGSVTVSGTIKRVVILYSSGGSICGHSGPGTYTSGHTNTISGFDNKAQSFVVLGRK